MALEKFVDMILSETLYFTNAAKMTDRNEGAVPRKTLQLKKKRLLKSNFLASELEAELSYFNASLSSLRGLTLINCWSINPSESYALWKIYLSRSISGVAIKSSVSKLKKAVKNGHDPYDEDMYLGKVRYTDFLSDKGLTRHDLITTKNIFYEFENEMRLYIFHYPRSEGGIEPPYNLSKGRSVRVDIDTLINKIYISPFSGEWFSETFRKMIRQIRPSLEPKIVLSDVKDE